MSVSVSRDQVNGKSTQQMKKKSYDQSFVVIITDICNILQISKNFHLLIQQIYPEHLQCTRYYARCSGYVIEQKTEDPALMGLTL